jgi:hypothetical protein
MLRDYMAFMAFMGLQYMQDTCHDRLMYINTFKTSLVMEYCYVMPTVYDPRLHQIHWTKGLSYADRWIDDHLHKTNILIKNSDTVIYEKDVAFDNMLCDVFE